MATDQASADLEFLMSLVREAGEIGMKYFKSDTNDVWYKNGHSPVSKADVEIDQFLKSKFLSNRSDYGWLSEETEDDVTRIDKQRVCIVDPIDGTRGFIQGSKQWCISIAVTNEGRPESSVLYCPALNQLFAAQAGKGLITQNVPAPIANFNERPLVTGSNKLIEDIRTHHRSAFDVSDFIPSLAYRLALVASGQLDGAFARAGAKEWDVVAADLILAESGCVLRDKHGSGLTYNNRSVNVPELIATKEQDYKLIKNLANDCGFLQ